MNKNNQDKQISAFDSGIAKEDARVVRYLGAGGIEGMLENKRYIEAFMHTQLGVEKILWDRIVGIFEGERAMTVREIVETSKEGKDKSKTKTAELIKWAHSFGAINSNEYSDLEDFNKKRNNIMHGAGQWWYLEEYKEALKKGIRFLHENGLE